MSDAIGIVWLYVCLLAGSATCVILSLALLLTAIGFVLFVWDKIDLYLCKMIWRRDDRVKAALQLTQWLVCEADRRGYKPFEGSIYRERCVAQFKIANMVVPDCIQIEHPQPADAGEREP